MSLEKEDRELLEELIESRNSNDNKNKSLRNLFDNRENPGFLSLKGVFTIITSIIGAIVLATIWWASVNQNMDDFDNRISAQQEEIQTLRKDTKEMFNTSQSKIENIKHNLDKIEDKFKEFKNNVKNDKEIFDIVNDRIISSIQDEIQSLKNDIKDLSKSTATSEMTQKEINYKINKLEERLNKSENLKKE